MCGCASAPGDTCPSTQAASGCYDLPWLYRDTNKFSMTCLSGGRHVCVGHSPRQEFHEAPRAGRKLPGQVPLENKPAQLGQWPSIWWGHCGMYGLNVWVQVWLGGVQGKEEISCKEEHIWLIFKEKKTTFKTKIGNPGGVGVLLPCHLFLLWARQRPEKQLPNKPRESESKVCCNHSWHHLNPKALFSWDWKPLGWLSLTLASYKSL